MNKTEKTTTEVYSYVFGFEKRFRPADAIGWMEKNWTVAYYIVTAYLILLYLGQRYMKTRSKFELRGALYIWNLMLSVFSVVAAIRVTPEIWNTVSRYGFNYSVCGHCRQGCTSVGQFWLWAFAISKVVELGDTAFIILRKQPLFFLHWYHHVTVLLYTFYSYATSSSAGRWFFFVNIYIHSMMYVYYALKSRSVRVPRGIAMFITVAQLSQMAFGCYITYYVYAAKRRGAECQVSDANVRASTMLYFSYFLLFLWYFYQSYFAKTSIKHSSKGIKNGKLE